MITSSNSKSTYIERKILAMRTFILGFVVFLFSKSAFSQTIYSPETIEKIKEVENNIVGQLLLNDEQPNTITERMAKYKVKGLSIAVIHNYKIEWAKAYGWADEEEKRPMTTETLFEPGSISKALNALGILKLAQDKKIDLSTDINTYLTSWKFPYDSLSKGKKINLAQILSHNAGLSVHGFPGHDIKGPIPTVIEILNGKKPSLTPAVRSVFEPDLKYQYSGGGTTISQLILTDVTKQDYDVWMYENVLKPIGMINSSYSQPPAKNKRDLCATAYRKDGTAIEHKFHVYPEQAAAGLWTTPSELCNYIIDMQLAYQGKTSKVLSPEMVKLHLTPYNNGRTSMGSFIEDSKGSKYFQHSAGNDGFCGQLVGSLDEGNGVVVLLNGNEGKLLSEVVNSVAKTYNWKNSYREPQRKKSIVVDESTLKTYEGIYIYENSWAGIGKKDSIYHFYTDNMYVKMYYTTPTSFFNTEFSSVKEFIKDEKGNITGYKRMFDDKEFPKAIKITNLDTLRLKNNFFQDIGWYLFEIKKYKESLSYLKRGVQLYPNDLHMLLNLAHDYLFNDEYDNAMTIYKAHLKDKIGPSITWVNQMQEDRAWFKDNKYDIKMLDKAFDELEIKKK